MAAPADAARRATRLPHGENPYQREAYLEPGRGRDSLGLPRFRGTTSFPPCYTNFADADALLQAVSLAAEGFLARYRRLPYLAAAAKHGNVCGFAADWRSPRRALDKALFGHPLAVWGGEVAVNFDVDGAAAAKLLGSPRRKALYGRKEWILDLILAPRFTREASEILGRRKGQKRLENPALRRPRLPRGAWAGRSVRGGKLRQRWPDFVLEVGAVRWEGRPLSGPAYDSLILAWAAAFSSFHGGNEIALAKNRALLSAGGGPSTVDAADVAVRRARRNGHDPRGAVFCADAFFPFPDAPRILARAGIRAGCAPLGSRNDPAVVGFLRRAGIAMAYLPPEIRGFFRH